MALIPQDEMFELKSATTVMTVASSAEFEQEKKTVAFEINNAANTGSTNVVINHPLSKQLTDLLTSNGYTITHNFSRVDPKDEPVISWKPVT